MNKKILAVAIAGALTAPSAFAATDTSGMQFTSAAEGFYASIRARFNSGGHDNAAADIQNSSSRFGVRGTNDLGGGLSGFYQLELGVGIDNGDQPSVRIGHVGLRGGWGQLMVGSGWTETYNMTYGSTDIANHHSGSLAYGSGHGLHPGRADEMIQYTSPDLSGFQGAVAVRMDNTGTEDAKDENDIDAYMFSAAYNVQGFTAAIAYINHVEAMPGEAGSVTASTTAGVFTPAGKKEDQTALVYRLGYAQDNWYVTGWYSKDNSSDGYASDGTSGQTAITGVRSAVTAQTNTQYTGDEERLSLAGGVSVGKVNLYAVYEALEDKKAAATVEDEYTTVGVQYNLGAQSRVWVEYAGEDLDSDPNTGDFISIGMQHNF